MGCLSLCAWPPNNTSPYCDVPELKPPQGVLLFQGGWEGEPLTTLAEVKEGLAVSLQVLVDGVALVVWLQGLQLVQEGKVLFGVLRA